MTVDCVQIVKDNHAGYATIRKEDFDPARHELFDPASDKPALVAEAVELKIGAKSTMQRWSVEKLKAEIAAVKA